MDRKDIFAFIAIYTLAVSATLFFGGSNEINVTSGDHHPESHIVQGESSEAVTVTFRQIGHDVSDIVQLPMIIVTPEAMEKEVAKNR